jgi:GNAT superfamily N-acetyltransferase
MRYQWPEDTEFKRIVLEPENRECDLCSRTRHICDHRHRKFFTLQGPVHLTSKLAKCPDPDCPGHSRTVSPPSELALAMPWWLIGWDVFAWIGHRRFARHWSVSRIRMELADSHAVFVSPDSIENHIASYQAMLAARQQDPERLATEYRDVDDVMLSIDGLQPEKGHETLYVVRELRKRRVWFAEPLLSSAAGEVRRLLEQAREWALRLGLPVKLWMSDKQNAFVTGIAEVFPGVPHRYCDNHFLRDLAKPVLAADSEAKVAMRRKVRGLRAVERAVLAQAEPSARDEVVLDYCAAVRGVLNNDQGSPLQPPGLKMADSLGEIRASLQRNLEAKKGATPKPASTASRPASTAGSRTSKRGRPR